jgi:hypothetical protein
MLEEAVASDFVGRAPLVCVGEPDRIEFKSPHLAVCAVAKHDGQRNAIRSTPYRGEIGHGVLLGAVTGDQKIS